MSKVLSDSETDGMQYTVAVHFLRLLTDYCDNQRLPAAQLLAEQGLSVDILDNANQRLPYLTYANMLDRAAALLDDPHLGLHLGQHVRPGHVGIGALAQLACANSQQQLQRMVRYSGLDYDAFRDEISQENGEVVLHWRCLLPDNIVLSNHHAELNFAIVQTLAPQFTGTSTVASRVHFRHSAPADSSELARFFRCPIYFDADVDSFVVPEAALDQPIQIANTQALAILDRICEQQLQQLQHQQQPQWLQHCKRAVVDSLKQGTPELPAIASALGMPQRTLRRQLAEQGLSFRQLVDELRKTLAEQYIAEPSLSLADIAALLGFSEQSAFQRAYRRWTGQSPGRARRDSGIVSD